jgi:hypothetical protein
LFASAPAASSRSRREELGLAPGKNVVGIAGMVNDLVEGKGVVRSFGMVENE